MTNSLAIKELIDINNRFKFIIVNNLYLFKKYDNEKIFRELYCKDYLIYYLSYYSYFNRVYNDIKSIKYNRSIIDNYNISYKNIVLGRFLINPKDYLLNRYLKLEQRLFNNLIQKPSLSYSIDINLSLFNMANKHIYSKRYVFNETEISNYIYKVKDKYNGYYKDKEVWNSICKIERAKVTNRMRFYIYKRDHYRCQRCHRSGTFNYLEVDHIKPISKGGKSTPNNLQTLCHRCNVEKGDRY